MFIFYTIYKPLYCFSFLQIGLIKKNGYLTSFLSNEIELNDFNLVKNTTELVKNTTEINNIQFLHVCNSNSNSNSNSISNSNSNTNTQHKISFYLLDELLDKTQKNPDCIVDPKIQSLLIDFFSQSQHLLDLPYEKPIITYVILPKSQYDFSLQLGLLRSSPESFMGPYYYFYCYRPIILEKKGQEQTHIVVKVALFLGKYHVIPFFSNNNNNKKKDFNNQKKRNLLNEYDTIYTFNPLTQTPFWVVKSNTQFQLLQQ